MNEDIPNIRKMSIKYDYIMKYKTEVLKHFKERIELELIRREDSNYRRLR